MMATDNAAKYNEYKTFFTLFKAGLNCTYYNQWLLGMHGFITIKCLLLVWHTNYNYARGA